MNPGLGQNFPEILQKYYSLKDVADKYKAVLATEAKMTRDEKIRLTRRDEKLRMQTTSPDDKEIEVQCTKSTSRYDDHISLTTLHHVEEEARVWLRRM